MSTFPKLILLFFTAQMFIPKLQAQFREAHSITGKYALVEQDGYLVTDYIFEELDRRSDTTFFARKGELYGLIDEKGATRIPFEYEAIELFLQPFGWQNGLAAVSKNRRENGSWGLVNLNGEVVLPLKFEYTRSIYPDLIVAREFRDSMLQFFNGNGEPLFTTPGRKVMEGFDEQSIQIERPDRSIFYADKKGKNIFKTYDSPPFWTDGKYVIVIRDRKFGVTNRKGKTIIPCEWERITPAGEELFIVQDSSYHLGLIDGKGKTILPSSPCELFQMGKEKDNVIIRKPEGARYAHEIYDAKGQRMDVMSGYVSVIDLERDLPRHPNSHPEWYLEVKTQTEQTQIIRKDGTPIIGPVSGRVEYYSEEHPLLVTLVGERAKNLGSYATDLDGEVVLPNGTYTYLSHTSDPKVLWASTEDKRTGFVHLDRPEEAEMIYQYTSRIFNGFWRAGLNNEYYLLSPLGEPLSDKGYAQMSDPDKNQVKRFQRDPKAKGRLRAVAREKETPYEEWIGLNEKGEAFYFSKEEEEAVVEEEEVFIDLPMEEIMDIALEEIAVSPREKNNEPSITESVNRYSSFPGGEKALNQFLVENLRYPELAMESALQGEVKVFFRVKPDGSLGDKKLIKDIGGDCGKEALRLLDTMPKWEPAISGGQAVSSSQVLLIKFELEEGK